MGKDRIMGKIRKFRKRVRDWLEFEGQMSRDQIMREIRHMNSWEKKKFLERVRKQRQRKVQEEFERRSKEIRERLREKKRRREEACERLEKSCEKMKKAPPKDMSDEELIGAYKSEVEEIHFDYFSRSSPLIPLDALDVNYKVY